LRRWRESTLAGLGRFQTLKNGVSEAWQPKSCGGATVAFMIPEGRHMTWLGGVPVVFLKPWPHPGFTVVLGTDGMRRIGLIVDAGEGNGRLSVVQR
jgi:hypothetical protein